LYKKFDRKVNYTILCQLNPKNFSMVLSWIQVKSQYSLDISQVLV